LAPARRRSGSVHQHPHALTDRSLSFLVRQAHRAFVATLADRLLPHGVSVAEWALLRRLWQEEGFTQVDLADRMRVRKASLTSVLASLEHKGLVRRTRRGADRRSRGRPRSPKLTIQSRLDETADYFKDGGK